MALIDLDLQRWTPGRGARRTALPAAVLALALIAGQAGAACGLCADSVTTNSSLAACFVERFERYAARDGAAVAVDLGDCETDRGVVEALSSPADARTEPDLRFMLTKTQLQCFRDRIADLGAELDPYATIRLDDCE